MMIRLRIYMTGIVQGVGFRPFIYRLAVRHGLGGWILNNGSGVQLEVEGEAAVIDTFLAAVQDEKPALSRIQTIKIESIPPENELTFRIRESVAGSGQSPLISPDIATCPDCWREAGNPADRRYRYPFTNCTNCGPRYSIITRTPYDRPFTTMSSFPMCPECRQEYENPANRRFHAQPNACPACGPHYRLLSRTGEEISFSGTAGLFEAARRLVQEGHILAVKGLGGYHLACDARSEKAVTLLRSRKIRKDKPFAALCASLVTAKLHCEISDSEAKLLTGPVRPIVLLRKSRQYALAPSVAPGNPRIGILLPYMPVHALLLDPPDIWVMTSGNVSDEPIAYEDEDALDRLKPIADYFLIHNRPIYRRVDDSVTAVFQGEPYLLRRSRGYVPVPIALAKNLPPVLACGGELKNTFCLTRKNQAFPSAHTGDLENMATFQYYVSAIDHDCRLLNIAPQIVAYDLHPEYLSSKYAQKLALPQFGVQHHHAHIAAVMAEQNITQPVIGVAYDGTGYGTDGALWGGEFLIADYKQFVRAAHCVYLPLPGGAQAIKEPWRLALWLLDHLFGARLTTLNLPLVHQLPAYWRTLLQATAQNINAPLTSSMGRLFDACAALLGLRQYNNYEGQAAIELERLAGTAAGEILPYRIITGTPHRLDFCPSFAALAEMVQKGADPQYAAASFHDTITAATVNMLKILHRETGLRQVALSGGVFQNMRLLTQLTTDLIKEGLTPLIHRQVPANDGGLSLGQAVIAGENFL